MHSRRFQIKRSTKYMLAEASNASVYGRTWYHKAGNARIQPADQEIRKPQSRAMKY